MVSMVPVLVRLLLQIGCLYILVCRLSQGLQQLLIAHLYILVRKQGFLVRRWSQLEFPCTLVVELLVRVQQPLRTGYLYRMAYQPFLVRRWLQIEFLYILFFQLSQGQLLHQIAHLYILVRKHGSLVRRWLQLEFPCTLVVELLSRVRLLLQTECLYRMVYQFSQGQLLHQIAHLYILARKAESPVRQWHQLEFPCTLVVEPLALVQQPLRTGDLYRMVYQFSQGQLLHQIAHLYILAGKAESPVRRWHQLEFPCILVVELLSLVQQPLRTGDLYRMAYQPFLVLPKPLIEHLQPLVPAFQVQQSHQLEFPCTLVVEPLALVQQPLRTGYLYRMAYQPFLVRRWLQIEFLYILVFQLS